MKDIILNNIYVWYGKIGFFLYFCQWYLCIMFLSILHLVCIISINKNCLNNVFQCIIDFCSLQLRQSICCRACHTQSNHQNNLSSLGILDRGRHHSVLFWPDICRLADPQRNRRSHYSVSQLWHICYSSAAPKTSQNLAAYTLCARYENCKCR